MGGHTEYPTHSSQNRSISAQELNDRISAIEDNWKQLCAHWNQTKFQDLYTRIGELTEQSDQLELHQLNESLISIEVYLSSFFDSPTKPSDEQQDAVAALMRPLRTTIELPLPAEEELPPLPQARPMPERIPELEPATATATAEYEEIASEMPNDVPVTIPGEAPILLFIANDSPASQVIDQLEQRDLKLQTVGNTRELLQALSEQKNRLILTDTLTLPEIEAIQTDLEQARSQHAIRPPLVFISDSNDLQLRIRAMRAGGEAFFVPPLDAAEVAQRVMELSSPCLDQPCRVMVVEDDPAQAEFASSILRKAKMEVLTVTEPMLVVDKLQAFHPNLILMDIYMPEVNGIELTAIIRDHKEFVATPIVFLSGEQSTDKQMDALSVGGDDFITKPIRPKHLLHVVNHRIRRINHLQQALGGRERKQHMGLLDKPKFMARINHCLQQPDDAAWTVFHLVPDQLAEIRAEHGLGTQDSLMGMLLQRVTANLGTHDLLCRLDDHSLTLLIKQDDADSTAAMAEQLREQIASQPFTLNQVAHNVTTSIGICPLEDQEHQEPAGVITRAARACAQALAAGGNQTKHYQPAPPKAEDSQTLALRDALENNSFVVMYQPLLDLQTRGSQNYEVMLHLPNEEGDLQSARQLREAAAKAGLLAAMDRWLLNHALDILAEHRSPDHLIRLFVPQCTLSDADHLAWLKEQLAERRLQGSDLVLEYQLAAISKNIEPARQLADRLREMKVGLGLTRFSEKPAAFKVLRLLRASYIRVAPRLLKADRETISHIINQVHLLSSQVIVSNVDDPRSIDLHWSSGADYLQGDFIQQPLEDMDYDFSQVVI